MSDRFVSTATLGDAVLSPHKFCAEFGGFLLLCGTQEMRVYFLGPVSVLPDHTLTRASRPSRLMAAERSEWRPCTMAVKR